MLKDPQGQGHGRRLLHPVAGRDRAEVGPQGRQGLPDLHARAGRLDAGRDRGLRRRRRSSTATASCRRCSPRARASSTPTWPSCTACTGSPAPPLAAGRPERQPARRHPHPRQLPGRPRQLGRVQPHPPGQGDGRPGDLRGDRRCRRTTCPIPSRRRPNLSVRERFEEHSKQPCATACHGDAWTRWASPSRTTTASAATRPWTAASRSTPAARIKLDGQEQAVQERARAGQAAGRLEAGGRLHGAPVPALRAPAQGAGRRRGGARRRPWRPSAARATTCGS